MTRGGFTDSQLLWTQFSPTRFHYILGHCQLFPPGSLCSFPPPRQRKRLQRGNRAAGAAADSRPVYTCARGSHPEQCHAWRSRATRAPGPAPLRLPWAGDSERGRAGTARCSQGRDSCGGFARGGLEHPPPRLLWDEGRNLLTALCSCLSCWLPGGWRCSAALPTARVCTGSFAHECSRVVLCTHVHGWFCAQVVLYVNVHGWFCA